MTPRGAKLLLVEKHYPITRDVSISLLLDENNSALALLPTLPQDRARERGRTDTECPLGPGH